MTYCIGMQLDDGLVFLSDSRTNAGVDHISTFRKMTVFEHPGERMLVLLSAGNLAVTQAVRQIVCERVGPHDDSVWNAKTQFEAVRVVGEAVREVQHRDGQALKEAGIEFNRQLHPGRTDPGEPMRLFQVYSAGNFIESTPENPYFQIGEAKYGKPIIDRVISPSTSLDEAAKCALISMDSTLRSNISVGLPLNLLVYEQGALRVTKFVQIDHQNQYMQMIRNTWGARLKQVFQEFRSCLARCAARGRPPRLETEPTQPPRAPLPTSFDSESTANFAMNWSPKTYRGRRRAEDRKERKHGDALRGGRAVLPGNASASVMIN